MLTFSYITLRSLERLDISVSPEERAAFFHTWNVIGSLMGLDERLFATSDTDAKELTDKTRARRMRASDDGTLLLDALLRCSRAIVSHETDGLIPRFILQRFPRVLLHIFLDKASVRTLRVRRLGPMEFLLLFVLRCLLRFFGYGYCRLVSFLGRRFAEAILIHLTKINRGNRPLFQLPQRLAIAWRVRAS